MSPPRLRPAGRAGAARPPATAPVPPFPVRPDVKFTTGRVLPSDEFKYSWERMIDPALKAWGASNLSNIVGYEDVRKQKTKDLTGVEVLDSTTIRVTLAQPDFTILNAMSLPITAPVPQEEVERLGEAQVSQTPGGFGPFEGAS